MLLEEEFEFLLHICGFVDIIKKISMEVLQLL